MEAIEVQYDGADGYDERYGFGYDGRRYDARAGKTVFSSNGEKIFLKGLIQKVKLSKTHTGCRVLDAPCAMAQMQEVLK